jgi:hypothetical protein
MMDRLRNIVKDTVELNLKSCSTLLELSKGYVKALDGIIRTSGRAAENAAQGAPSSEPPRAPLLLAGEAGEDASGAFIINNPSASNLNLTFAVQGQLGADDVKVVPPSLALNAGEEAVVRVKVRLTKALDENRDYVGVVFVPALSSRVIDFVVRRLPSQAQSPRSKAAGKN